MINPKVEARMIEVMPSRIPFVKDKYNCGVKSSFNRAQMDKVPIQYSKIAVDNPSDDLELLNF